MNSVIQLLLCRHKAREHRHTLCPLPQPATSPLYAAGTTTPALVLPATNDAVLVAEP